MLIIFGTVHATNIKVESYDVSIPKPGDDLNIVLLSDIHIDSAKRTGYVQKMVRDINYLQPDLVLLAGDIFDDRDHQALEREIETLRGIESKYGVYGVLGNHEYYGGNLDETIRIFSEANIITLRDEYIEVAGVNLIGRDDVSKKDRKKLEEIMTGMDKSKPIIVLDHQPVNLEEPKNNGVDLQLSGHTHKGQFFPNQFVTRKLMRLTMVIWPWTTCRL
ncbi:hypothetical protein N752_28025 [Desulforamulus aquiferis]|nr:metallophosphoesterase [Desulforamulus aquiferis]RYD01858.1 hypothetical protein N752_28025 [Desulforamulus aquiferis]